MKRAKRIIALKLVFLTAFVSVFCWTGFTFVSGDDQGLVAQYKFDGNLNDSSGNGNDGTAVGSGIKFTDGVNGQCAEFDGGSYIEVKDSDSLDLKNSFAISMWIYKGERKEDHYFPVVKKMEGTDGTKPPYEVMESDDYFSTLSFAQASSTSDMNINSKMPVDISKWTLETYTWNGNKVNYYINDKLIATSDHRGELKATDGSLLIGFTSIYRNPKLYFKGRMDDLRIYNRELSKDEVRAIYSDISSKAPVVGMQKKLVLNCTFDGNIKDSSGFQNNGTVSGNIKFAEGVAGTGGNSDAAVFDGKSLIKVSDGDSLDLEKGFTFSAWVNPKDFGNLKYCVIGKEEDSIVNAYPYLWTIYKPESVMLSNYFTACNLRGITEFNSFEAASKERARVNMGSWLFMTVTYDGSSFKEYMNGKLADTDNSVKGLVISHNSGNLLIGGGKPRNCNATYFKGLMDELRIYNYALTDKEIVALYNQRNSLSVSAKTTMKAGQAQNIKVSLKPLRGSVSDVTGKATIVIGGKNSKLLKYSNGKLSAIGKGTASFTVKYKNLSASCTVNIK